ncbi:MAG: stage II sporulation protein M [Lachnospiraceae bacterium]|nr:stage II sporulation protein M [Lachnospiraceae bacterium]
MKVVNYSHDPYKKETPKWFLPFAAGIVLGVFLFFSNQGKFVEDTCFFGEDILKRFGYSSIYREAFFCFVLKNRLKLFLLLAISAFTSLFSLVYHLFFGWCGMSTAVIALTLLIKYGWKGLLLLFGLFLPHMLFYVPCFLYLMRLLQNVPAPDRAGQSCTGGRNRMAAASGMKIAAVFFLLLMTLLMGIVVESYVNPVLLKNLIKIL